MRVSAESLRDKQIRINTARTIRKAFLRFLVRITCIYTQSKKYKASVTKTFHSIIIVIFDTEREVIYFTIGVAKADATRPRGSSSDIFLLEIPFFFAMRLFTCTTMTNYDQLKMSPLTPTAVTTTSSLLLWMLLVLWGPIKPVLSLDLNEEKQTLRKDTSAHGHQTAPSWDELDARPLPRWYDDAKFGIFLHWGIFSVPAFGSEWFWSYWKDMKPDRFVPFVRATEKPGFTYQEYAHRFTCELYHPEQWAEYFAQSGAQYVVLTSKHHEGYCTFCNREFVSVLSSNKARSRSHLDNLFSYYTHANWIQLYF
jgi:hypothetical protein